MTSANSSYISPERCYPGFMKELWWRTTFPWILILFLGSGMSYAWVATTLIQDTVYHANGTVATGTLIITWPAFTTAAGEAIPAGNTSAQIGTNGAVSLSLTPNIGATPAGTYYTAVYHLDDGSVSKEYWVVPNVPTTTITAMRSEVMPASVAVQTVSQSYVSTALNNYLPLSGGSLQGALLLNSDPQNALQAATKEYVDTNVQGIAAALNEKVATAPSGNQAVVQPAGTTFSVNTMQGKYYASQYQSGTGGNGIANAIAGSNCANSSVNGQSGCTIMVEPTYPNTENPQGYGSYLFGNKTQNMTWPFDTHVRDERNGVTADYFENPISNVPFQSAGHSITANFTFPYQSWSTYGSGGANLLSAEYLQTTDYAGGINFDNYFGGLPEYLFKPYYGNLNLATTNYTSGQQQAIENVLNCHGVGDCLAMSTYVTCDGGWQTGNDEGCHGGDFGVTEDPAVYRGVVVGSFPNGTVQLPTSGTSGAGTEGQDRTLLDTLPSKVISGGPFTGYVNPAPTGPASNSAITPPAAINSAANWPVSTMVELCNAASNNGGGTCTAGNQPTGFVPSAPGMIQPAASVTLNIVAPYTASGYSGLPAGFCSSTNLQSSSATAACYMPASGVGCLASSEAFETVNYTYNMTSQTVTIANMLYPHANGMTFATGGLCQAAVENTANTASFNGIRQVFPIIGSVSPTEFYYYSFRPNLGYTAAVLGVSNVVDENSSTGGNLCVSLNLTVFSLQADGRTVEVAGYLPPNQVDYSLFNGLAMTVSTSNASYNGTYTMSYGAPAGNWLSYVLPANATGTAPTSGTATFCNMNYNIYPSAQVQSVYDTATASVDGTMTLMPNSVNWGNNDPVEEAHYPWIYTSVNVGQLISQWLPRPDQGTSLDGVAYRDLLSGQGYTGFTISNTTAQNLYLGYGGTHYAPGEGIGVNGDWRSDFATAQPPEPGGAVLQVYNCKPSPIGCNNPNSAFAMLGAPNGGQLSWDPNSETWNFGNANNGNPVNLSTPTSPVVMFASNIFTNPSISASGWGLTSNPVANAGFSGQWYAFPANGTNTLDTFLDRTAADTLNCGKGGSDASCTLNAGTINAATAVSTPAVDATTSVTAATLIVGGGSAIAKVTYYSTSSVTPIAVPAQSCNDQAFAVAGLTGSDNLGSITPPAALGNVSLNGYANAANTVNLHFCNPSTASVTPPAGVYRFVAMH